MSNNIPRLYSHLDCSSQASIIRGYERSISVLIRLLFHYAPDPFQRASIHDAHNLPPGFNNLQDR